MVINNPINERLVNNAITAQGRLAKSLARLSSGSKIVVPQDDAAGLAVASRAETALTKAQAARDNQANMVSYSQTQAGVLKTMDKTLRRMSELTMLYKDASKPAADRALYQQEFDQLKAVVSQLKGQKFNDVPLFTSATATSATQVTDATGKQVNLNPVNLTFTPSPPSVPRTITTWGANTYGEMTLPAGLNPADIQSIDSWSHTLALKTDGTVAAWGYNAYGQATVPAGLNNVTAVVAGGYHSLALKSDGTVVAWGNNDQGRATVPAGLTNVTAISAGDSFSTALKSDGTVVAWGDNSNGRATVPAGLTNVVAIESGNGHTLALKSDGTIVTWGNDTEGQSNVPGGLNNVIAVSGAYQHSLALKSDGTVVAWGSNTYGQTSVPAGLNNVTAINATGYHSTVLKSDGTVVAWGRSDLGEINVPAGLTGVTSIKPSALGNFALTGQPTTTSDVPLDIADLAGVSAALEVVAKASGTIGANMARVENEIEQGTMLAETLSQTISRIIDTDVAAEAVEYARNQILTQGTTELLKKSQQLGQSALKLIQ